MLIPTTNPDSLLIGGHSIAELALRVGQTPFYAYDRALINQRIDELRQHIPKSVHIHYAIKANPMPAVVDYMSKRIDGLDVASGQELLTALNSGVSPQNVSFAGPGKREQEIIQAIASKILINIESLNELNLVSDLSKKIHIKARVAIRVNPDFELKMSGMKMGGGPKQFGIDAELIPEILKTISSMNVNFEGFHLYAGSQNLKAEAIIESQIKSFDLAMQLSQHMTQPLQSLNLGGGFGIPYFHGDQKLDLKPIGKNLQQLSEQLKKQHPQAQLTIELGRYLVGEAGFYICRVVERKNSRGQVFLVVDGGMHHHLAAAGHFGQVIRKNYPVALASTTNTTEKETVSVVGPLCTPMDLLADQMELPKATIGDFVVIFQSGAYGFTASPHLFLSQPRPIEVLI